MNHLFSYWHSKKECPQRRPSVSYSVEISRALPYGVPPCWSKLTDTARQQPSMNLMTTPSLTQEQILFYSCLFFGIILLRCPPPPPRGAASVQDVAVSKGCLIGDAHAVCGVGSESAFAQARLSLIRPRAQHLKGYEDHLSLLAGLNPMHLTVWFE